MDFHGAKKGKKNILGRDAEGCGPSALEAGWLEWGVKEGESREVAAWRGVEFILGSSEVSRWDHNKIWIPGN